MYHVFLLWENQLWTSKDVLSEYDRTIACSSIVAAPDDGALPALMTIAAAPRQKAGAAITFGAAMVDGKPLTLNPGLYLVFGGTGAGKTRALGALLRSSSVVAEYHEFGEPTPSSWVPTASVLAMLLEKSLNTTRARVVGVDSITDFLTASQASQGRGGISKAVKRLFLDLSKAATAAGVVLFFLVNTLDLSDADELAFRKMMSGATSGSIHIASSDEREAKGEITVRAGRRLPSPIIITINAGDAVASDGNNNNPILRGSVTFASKL